MRRAQLLPCSRSHTSIEEHCASLLLSTHGEIRRSYATLRKRYSALLRRARKGAFQRGYSAGLSAGRNRIEVALRDLGNAYTTVLDGAKDDCRLLAQALAAQIVGTSINERPEILLSWLDRAMTIMKHSQPRVLRYHPRLAAVIQSLHSLIPAQLELIPDSSLEQTDFRLESETGGVECQWREEISGTPIHGSHNPMA